MKCPSEIELNEYAEDRLATERRWEVARHLQECPGCRTDLEGLDWATVALGALEHEEPAEEGHAALEDLAALREGKLPPLRRAEVLRHLSACPECAAIYGQLPREQRELPLMRHWQPMAAAAGLLLVIGLVFFVARDNLAPGLGGLGPARPRMEIAPPATTAAPPETGAAAPGAVAEAPAAPAPSAASRASARPPSGAPRDRGLKGRHRRAGPTRHFPAHVTPAKPVDRDGARGVGERGVMGLDDTRRPDDGARVRPMGVTPAMPGVPALALPPVPAAPGMPAAPPTAVAPGGDHGVGSTTVKTTDLAGGTRQNMTQTPVSFGTAQKLHLAATFPPLAAPPSGAPGPGSVRAATAMEGQVTSQQLANNFLRFDQRSLELIRNDPQRKAQVKAILKQMLQQEKSGERNKLIRQALRSLETPPPGRGPRAAARRHA